MCRQGAGYQAPEVYQNHRSKGYQEPGRRPELTIDEAIEILKVLATNKDIYTVAQGKEARQLGIEALRRHKNKASLTFAGMMEPLPGETEE